MIRALEKYSLAHTIQPTRRTMLKHFTNALGMGPQMSWIFLGNLRLKDLLIGKLVHVQNKKKVSIILGGNYEAGDENTSR